MSLKTPSPCRSNIDVLPVFPQLLSLPVSLGNSKIPRFTMKNCDAYGCVYQNGASTNNHMNLADHRWCEHTANHILINQPGYFSLVLWDFAQTRLNDHFASTLSQNQTRNLFPHCQTPHKLRSHPRSLPAAVKHHWLPLRSLTFEMYFAGTVPLIPGDKITSLALWKKGTPSWGTDFGWNLVSWSKLCLTGDIQNSKWSSHLIQAKTEKLQGHKTGNVPWLDHISTLFFALLLN